MNIQPISYATNTYGVRKIVRHNIHSSLHKNQVPPIDSTAFRGDTGAAIGIVGGAAVGALTAAIIVASGGLAAPVAAYGLGTIMTAGAGAGTHLGGIIGGIIEEKLNKSDNNDNK